MTLRKRKELVLKNVKVVYKYFLKNQCVKNAFNYIVIQNNKKFFF